MQKPESVSENETQIIMPARRPDQVIIDQKNNLLSSEFCRPSEQQSENQIKRKKRQVLRPCQRTKKAKEHDDDDSCNWRVWNGSLRLRKG